MKTLPNLIQNTNDLSDLMAQARMTDAIALDTEFIWERTYYPQLGLIQLALSDEECFLIDPLRCEDLRPLGELLENRSVVKILHDAPQDLVILGRATKSTPQNIFDTRLAAGFADLPATLSLGKLIHELLDINLTKTQTRTNWLQRPLSSQQIEYALDDVRYLRAVRVLLLSRIIGPKIRSWLQEELNLLNNPTNYSPDHLGNRYLKTRGSSSLDRRGLEILKLLTVWREGMARKRNRPRGHILKDKTLIEIGKMKPTTSSQLKDITPLSDKARSKYGEAILAICQKADKTPDHLLPERPSQLRLNSSEKKELDRLRKLIELKCSMLGVAPEIIANSSECKRLVKAMRNGPSSNDAELRQTYGWRKIFLEEFFQQIDNK